MRPSLSETYYYEIKELGNEERVAVGSNDNVLRWAPNGGSDQLFAIIPKGDVTWQIVSMKNGKYLAVGSDAIFSRMITRTKQIRLLAFKMD